MIQAVTYHKAQDSFQIETISTPQLETEYDVLVKVKAVGLNPVDSKINFWHSSIPDMDDNFVGGLDVCGEILAMGEKVTGWALGDRVVYHGNMKRQHGGFAQMAVHDSRTLIAAPEFLSDLELAATPCAGWTAYRALVDKLAIHSEDTLFIAGGAGGVGSYAIAIAKALKVRNIITTCSSAKADYVRSLGATHVIDYHTQDVVETILDITDGQGVSKAFDCVGGEQEQVCADVLSLDGQMLELVQTANPTSYSNAFLRGLTVHHLSLGAGHGHGKAGRDSILNAGLAMTDLQVQGVFRGIHSQHISFKQIPEALQQIRQKRTQGKIVALVNA